MEAGLPEEGRLLVAGGTAHRYSCQRLQAGDARLHRAVDGAVLHRPGQHTGRDPQQATQLLIPAQPVDIKEHGAGGVGVVGDVLPRQPPDEPRLHRAEQQLPPFRPLPGAGDVIQDPADLGAGEIGVDEQSRGGDDALLQSLPLQLLAQLRRPTALPDDGVIHRLAGGLIPNDGGLPLVGDADAGDAALRQPPDGLRRRQTLRVPDGHGVVLHPARLRIDLGKGVLGLGGDLPRPVKYDGTGAGRPLIQCQNIRCHSRLLFSFWWVYGILSIEWFLFYHRKDEISMTNLTEFTFLSSDGKTQLHAMQWLPEGTPRAVLQISHGVAEHIGRYDGFARYLNEQGLAVVGHDHLGHGGSLPEGGTPVYFGDGTPWETVVADIQLLHEQLRREFSGVPLCLMGHSMGSFLARSYLIRYPGTLRAAIIMGTGWQPQAKLTGGRAVAEVVCAAQGPSAASKLVNDLAFGGYNKAFAPNRTGYDWLSADSENVDRYIADPLCGADATVGLFRQMLHGIAFNQNPKNLARMDSSLPVLLISGDRDPVGDMGKGVRRTADAFRKAGLSDVTLKLYPGLRHEILNEGPMRQTVYEDIWHWLEPHLPAR